GSLDPERVLDLAAECIDRARSEMARQGLELTRVSVGLPAIIDHRSGTVQTSLDFRWGEVPVVDRLQQRTGGDLSFTLDRLANLAIREGEGEDRKSTRLNSSHVSISYAV